MGFYVGNQNHNLQYAYRRTRNLANRSQSTGWAVHEQCLIVGNLDNKTSPLSPDSVDSYTYYEQDVSNWACKVLNLDWLASLNVESTATLSDSMQKHIFKAITKKKGKKYMNIRNVRNYCKEKISDHVRHQSIHLFDRTVEKLETKAMAYGFSVLKNAVGVEHIFTLHRDGSTTIQAVNEFIKKYDKHFQKHTVISHSEKDRRVTNKQFIVMLDSMTFMYIAAGNALGDTEDRYFQYNSLSDIDLYLYICGYNAQQYETELVDMLKAVDNRESLGIYQVTNNNASRYDDDENCKESLHITYTKMSPRSLDTLYFSSNEKTVVVDHIDRFDNQRAFYENKQILYKTGILLYGMPGTGKSSFVKTLATKYGRSIINIDIAKLQSIDLNSLAQSIMVDEKRYIVLFEDIDTLFLNRSDTELRSSETAVINKLLQFLDSNSSPTNVIFIATTNHIERLDSALLREGRFDLKVEVKPLSRPEAELFGKSFDLSEDMVTDILNTIDSESTERGMYNQSRLQARLLACIENKSYEESVKLHCEE